MPGLRPADPEILATAVADSLVVAVDKGSSDACLFFYYRARPWVNSVVEAVRASEDPQIRKRGELLLDTPDDPDHYHLFKEALLARGNDAVVEELFEKGWQAETRNRLGYFLGSRYRNDVRDPVTAEQMSAMAPVNPPSAAEDAEILVVIPFQDRNPERRRLRNLLACLMTLHDQSYPRDRYRVVVVESDDQSRHREIIEPFVDEYFFAPKGGLFSKSWAVNVGVVAAVGKADAICILDADVLADRDFIARNAERLSGPGTSGHLTYQSMHCLSEKATVEAIQQRIIEGAGQPDTETLRGFVMRRPPGCCVWARTSAFMLVNGMDERFEGWGGEDNDFAYRMDVHSAFHTYNDWLLHMWHPPSSVIYDNGELPSSWIPKLSWSPDEPIGRIDKFTTPEVSGTPA